MTKKITKSKIGRPTKLTPAVVSKLEDAFKIGCNTLEACAHAEISRDTYYKFVEKNQEISDRFEEMKQQPVLKARQTVFKNLNNPKIAWDYLQKSRPEEFRERTESVSFNHSDINLKY